ncbi:hypothetical protein EW145_g1356 [Phellinidium pouzarii]|uniref:Cytochrome P450 n=1 Tax=Phellinidium pouzarii TaxID=167371 RepID=A0A4V3XDN1_9AGAM|nr:hypothetical protein EW145_g1356 [Phellinidium pouzarii]
MLPPGICFLLSGAPRLTVRTLTLALAYHASQMLLLVGYDLKLPNWLKAVLLFLSLLLTAAVNVIWSNMQNKRDARSLGAVLPPAVKGNWPGNIDTLFSALNNEKTAYTADIITHRSKELGWTFNWRLFWEDKILTSEPELIKAGDHFKDLMRSVLGSGAFNSDGEMWKYHRSMTRPFFSKDRVLHVEVFKRHADEAIELMKVRLREGHAIDFQDLMSRFTMDSATEFLFGHCGSSLSSSSLPYPPNAAPGDLHGNNAPSLFSEAFAEAQLLLIRRTRYYSLWPLFEFWEDKTQKHMKVINAFIEPMLQEAIKKKKEYMKTGSYRENDIEQGDTLLSHLINITKDMKVLKDEILNIMIAGKDTTAAVLTFAIYCLAMHPEILKRLREEILTVIGSERSPTSDDMKEMKYLRAVINETLRLYPPVPFNQRASINATTLPNKTPGSKPWYIPAQTNQRIRPDRFLDARLHTYLAPNPFIFLPFNAGPRICLGQQFAYNEVSFMLIRLLQAFDAVALAPDAQAPETRPPAAWARETGSRKSRERVWLKSHLTMYVHGGLWVCLREAAPSGTASI